MLPKEYSDFIKRVNSTISKVPHGQITVVVLLKGGIPEMKTYGESVMRRRKYKMPGSY